jgi:sugar lactone lactonase YvrE
MQPNGIVLSPDGKVAYITDTGLFRPDVRTSPHTIYTFDIVRAEYVTCAVIPSQKITRQILWPY